MFRKVGPAVMLVAVVALSACGRKDNATYDTAAGAVATPPPYTPPPAGLSVGATTGTTTGTTTGATTKVRDTLTKRPPG
jgi:major membrane immunogen (membrane-anchored lipoprotein)